MIATDTQIAAFAAVIDDNFGYCADDVLDAYTLTADELVDFTTRYGRADEVIDGVHHWYKVQPHKGAQRRSLTIQDLGDCRVAFVI